MIKGLEMLEILKQRNCTLKINHKIGSRDIANQEIKEITQCFDNYVIPIIERELKALEIIKKCGIKVENREDFDVIGYATFRKNGKYRYYINDIEITQEEFDSLKEVLKDEK